VEGGGWGLLRERAGWIEVAVGLRKSDILAEGFKARVGRGAAIRDSGGLNADQVIRCEVLLGIVNFPVELEPGRNRWR
jgi:hypothetical protein